MRRIPGETLLACVLAGLVGLLYLGPMIGDVRRTGLDWPIWIDHAEGLIHTNTGKWLVAPPHRNFVEGQTGEFPQYYPSFHDTLLNAVGALVGAPAMSVQAVVFGPLLGAAFLLFNYLSLAAVLPDRRVALSASLILSLGGNSSLLDRHDPASGLALHSVLHVPFHTISLATAQSLGWVLFLPTLVLGYLAHREFRMWRAVGAGFLLGVLFHTHTLTFVNVGAAQLAWLVLANARERPRDGRFKAWLLALGLVAAIFSALSVTRASLSFAILAGLGTLALAATFWVDPNRRFYAWTYGTAGMLALPYVLMLVRHRGPLATMQDGWHHVQTTTVGMPGFVLFFAGYLVAAAVGYYYARTRVALDWVVALLAATAFLAVNHLWGWGNHPYRYAIHLLFPLAILGALGLHHSKRPLAAVIAVWLGVVCLHAVWNFGTGQYLAVRFRVAEPERAGFLETVRDVTAREAASGVRILTPVELTYPRGLVQAAMLMNYSRVPAFVPDYRHVLWPERHHNRMGLFCFLFPGYPNLDYPFGWRACEEDLDPDPELVTIRDLRLKTQVLSLYRIGFAAAPAKPFSNHLKEQSPHYGWPMLLETANAAFVRTEVAALPGVARLSRAEPEPGTLAIRVEPELPGAHVVILGGRRLDRRAPAVVLDERPLEHGRRRGNWAIFYTELDAGRHLLELPSLEAGPDPEADFLYFVAVVSRERASQYLALGDAATTARDERQFFGLTKRD